MRNDQKRFRAMVLFAVICAIALGSPAARTVETPSSDNRSIDNLLDQAEALAAEEKHREAAELLLDAYRGLDDAGKKKHGCELLYEIAVNMEAARLVTSAIKVREALIEGGTVPGGTVPGT